MRGEFVCYGEPDAGPDTAAADARANSRAHTRANASADRKPHTNSNSGPHTGADTGCLRPRSRLQCVRFVLPHFYYTVLGLCDWSLHSCADPLADAGANAAPQLGRVQDGRRWLHRLDLRRCGPGGLRAGGGHDRAGAQQRRGHHQRHQRLPATRAPAEARCVVAALAGSEAGSNS